MPIGVADEDDGNDECARFSLSREYSFIRPGAVWKEVCLLWIVCPSDDYLLSTKKTNDICVIHVADIFFFFSHLCCPRFFFPMVAKWQHLLGIHRHPRPCGGRRSPHAKRMPEQNTQAAQRYQQDQEIRGAIQGVRDRKIIVIDFAKNHLFREIKFRMLKTTKPARQKAFQRIVLVNCLNFKADNIDGQEAAKVWGEVVGIIESTLRIRKNSVVDAIKKKMLSELCVCVSVCVCVYWHV